MTDYGPLEGVLKMNCDFQALAPPFGPALNLIFWRNEK